MSNDPQHGSSTERHLCAAFPNGDAQSPSPFAVEDRLVWFEFCTEGLFRIDVRKPLCVNLRQDEQIEHLLEHGWLGVYNDVLRHMLTTGCLADTPRSNALLRDLASSFIAGRYEIREMEIMVGGTKVVVSAYGLTNGGKLEHIWGSCRMLSYGDDAVVLNALERQRQQIGLELHDGIGQLLTALRLTSQDLAESLADHDATIHRQAQVLALRVDDALALLRSTTSDLSPAALVRGDTLKTALDALVALIRETGRVECILEWHGHIRIPDSAVRVHAYRIVQEAVNNAVKHSRASSIRVVGRRLERAVELSICDDGVGFQTSSHRPTLGIESLHRRSETIGATLSIRSGPGEGTVVTCCIPVRQ